MRAGRAGQGCTVARFAVPTPGGQGGRGRAAPSPGLPYRPSGGAARRNPDTPVPAHQPYRARRAYQRHSRTPYAPGAPGEPGRTAGNAEQSAPADRSVATARRASDTDSGSAASYTTPQTTRRPRLAWMNQRRRSAHGTTVTRQSRTLTLTSHPRAPGSAPRAPGGPTPAPT
jgi:hypothetical protein